MAQTCRFHRDACGEPFVVPQDLIVAGEIAEAQLRRLLALVPACHHKWYRLGPHSADVSDLAFRLGMHCDFDMRALVTLRYGGLLHDLGKIFIALDTLLCEGRLSEEQWDDMRRHPSEGALLISHPRLAPLAGLAGCHHVWPGNPGADRGGLSYPPDATAEEIEAIARGGHAYRGRRSYPANLGPADLDDNKRLMSVVDWYAGCREPRLYKGELDHATAIRWTYEAAAEGKVDPYFTKRLAAMLEMFEWHPAQNGSDAFAPADLGRAVDVFV